MQSQISPQCGGRDRDRLAETKTKALPRRFRHLVALCCAATAWTIASDAVAQYVAPEPLSRTRIELPIIDATSGPASNRGFNVSAEFSHLFAVGYAGVTLELKSTTGPLAATRRLTVRITPIDRHVPADQAVAIRLPIEFPQGQSEVRAQRLFPKWTLRDAFRVEIAEDGVLLDGYVAEVGATVPTYALQSPISVMPNETRNNVLLVDTDVQLQPPPPIRALRFGDAGTAWQQKRWDELPTDWRLLRDIDCVVIRHDRLRTFASTKDGLTEDTSEDRERYLAIRDWILMGGVLVVVEAPAREELQPLLGVTLGVSEDDLQDYRGDLSTIAAEAKQRVESMKQVLVDLAAMPAGSVIPPGVMPRFRQSGGPSFNAVEGQPKPSSEDMQSSRRWVSQYDRSIEEFQETWSNSYRASVGAGVVMGVPPEAMRLPHVAAVLERATGYRKSALLTRGVEPLMGDARNDKLLIPGVAEPPVYSFIAILTLFVLLVGPVAYRWTTRGHRSHLMFLIAPSLALLTTVSMFAYSILADGFGTTARVRQLTWVESASGDAAERTRLTLFSGISPSDGLRFDASSELLPYPDGGSVDWRSLPYQVDTIRLSMTADGQTQRFPPAILPSRTQSQFVSHRIRRNVGQVRVTNLKPFDAADPDTASATVTVSNGLPFELREFVVRTADGRYWSADRIDSAAEVQANWIPKIQQTSKQLGNLYNRFRMRRRVGQSGRPRGGQRITDLISYFNRQVDRNAEITDGGFESWLNEYLFVRGELPPGVFVAISEPSEDAVPVVGAEQVESVRFVMGTLR